MNALNYNHLRYFWVVAHEGHLGHAAERLNVSQSSLSVQIKSLEDQLGHKLFERRGRGLHLTEAGHVALDYADTIFRAGEQLTNTLKGRRGAEQQVLRLGAITTLSRNFQLALLKPLIGRRDLEIVVHSGSLRELLAQLEAHNLDLVIANRPPMRDARSQWQSRLLDQQPVSLVSRPNGDGGPPPAFRFPDDLAHTPVLLPSLDSDIRLEFDRALERAGIRPPILAEVDDMAMLRLLARESPGVTLVPPVVVRDELDNGLLVERCAIAEIKEYFHAIVPTRRFRNQLVEELVENLAMRAGGVGG